MGRLTDNDKRIGPLTWGKTSWRCIALTLESHGGDEGHPWNALVVCLCGIMARPWEDAMRSTPKKEKV